MLPVATTAALFFSTYETSKKAWAESPHADNMPLAAQHMSSAMAGEVVCSDCRRDEALSIRDCCY